MYVHIMVRVRDSEFGVVRLQVISHTRCFRVFLNKIKQIIYSKLTN